MLVNSNPATNMTDPDLAGATYTRAFRPELCMLKPNDSGLQVSITSTAFCASSTRSTVASAAP